MHHSVENFSFEEAFIFIFNIFSVLGILKTKKEKAKETRKRAMMKAVQNQIVASGGTPGTPSGKKKMVRSGSSGKLLEIQADHAVVTSTVLETQVSVYSSIKSQMINNQYDDVF